MHFHSLRSTILCRIFAAFMFSLVAAIGIPQVGVAQEEEAPAEAVTAVTVTPAGVQRFANGGWASMTVVGVNRTDDDAEEVVSMFVGKDPNLQFSTKFWVPAHSKRQSWMPVAVPSADFTDEDRVNLSTIRLSGSEGAESFTENINQMPISERSAMLTNGEINTGLISDPSELLMVATRAAESERIVEIVNLARDSITSTPSDFPLISFNSVFLPPTHRALDQMDQVVIAGDQLLNDSEGMIAVRRWIRHGGRAWIMLDRVSQGMVQQLLGDDGAYTEIDRVELNDLEIEFKDPFSGRAWQPQAWTSEIPVTMLRVFTEADDVPCHVNGWPAAYWKRVGDGEVLFTTLGAEGWVNEKTTTSQALNQLSRRLFEPKNEPTEFVQALVPIVDEQIGYQIPSRSVAAIVLAVNLLALIIFGGIWTRRRQLDRMAVLVPVSALATTAVMLGIGSHHARSVPSTVATGQVVQVRASGEADITTVRAVYSQQAGPLGLVSGNHVLTMPSDVDATSETRRLRFDDNGTSRWFGPDQPPGVVRHLISESSMQLVNPIRVRGSFDDQGFRGTLIGLDAATCEDGLIVSLPAPMTSARFDASGDSAHFVARQQDRLPVDQFVPGAMLSDKQRKRDAFLRQVFAEPENNSLGWGPSLLLWTSPLDLGVRFEARFTQNGPALISIPIHIDRPQPGIEIRIPSTFIHVDTFASESGRSTIYNPRNGTWLKELTKPSETQLLFEFPRALSEMTLSGVTISMKVNAPSRTLFVKAMVDGEPATMFEKENANGVVQFTIDRPDALRFHSSGALWLSFGVSESAGQSALNQARNEQADPVDNGGVIAPEVDNTTWQIDYVHLDAVGQIKPGTQSSNDKATETGKP
ncbi:MAG: hypothetical protein KDB00_28895 [Planctomycetales bacterium]|nr:hypothetical protein [Planctomycetales bacterium]